MSRKRNSPKYPVTVNSPQGIVIARRLRALASCMLDRTSSFSSMGKSFNGARDLYTAAGYPLNPQFPEYDARYERQDIAKRIVDAYPNATWRAHPEIREDKSDPKKPTEFELAWLSLVKKIKGWHYILRADKVSGIGRFGCLLIGFNDSGADFASPVGATKEVLYLQAFSEGQVTIDKWESNIHDKRFGKPLEYQVEMQLRGGDGTKQINIIVHWSRMIHLADGCTTDDIYGTPRLKAVYNRLQDIETVMAGAAEMFWKAGWPGMAFQALPDADISTQDLDDLEDHIEDYMHGLVRYLRLQGIEAKTLQPNITDPTPTLKAELMLVSGASGLPQRILTGSEEGKLASIQDDANWQNRVDERRKDYAEPMILRPFIDRLIEHNVLPEPKDGPEAYKVIWQDIQALSEKDQAEIAKVRTLALTKYASTPGIEFLIGPQDFLDKIMNFDQSDIEHMMVDLDGKLLFEKTEQDRMTEGGTEGGSK